jgi:hypothetical protein
LLVYRTKSEGIRYDGVNAYPLRPYAPGQPRTVALDGNGNIDGTVRYKYAYIDTTANDTSNMSAPSWPIQVDSGQVWVYGLADSIDATTQHYIILFRETDEDGDWEIVKSFKIDGTREYRDTTGTTNDADTTTYRWGCTLNGIQAPVIPPGAMTVTVDTLNHTEADSLGIGVIVSALVPIQVTVGYGIVFEDTAHRASMMSPAVWDTVCTSDGSLTNWNYKATLTNIPVPQDSGIVRKRLIRSVYVHCGYSLDTQRENDFQLFSWFAIDTLDDTTTTHIDSVSPFYTHFWEGDTSNLYCGHGFSYQDSLIGPGVILIIEDTIITYGQEPESTCYQTDTVITFQPETATMHGSRTFSAGNRVAPNRIYYSDFGSLSRWPFDKTILIPSTEADWPIYLLSLPGRLIAFKQHSVWQVEGLYYSNFAVSPLIMGIGLTGPRTVAAMLNRVYFAHMTGIYAFDNYSGITPQPLSLRIDKTIDSIKARMYDAWGGMIGQEYWFSGGLYDTSTRHDRTYIYSDFPVPHWKCYTFGLDDRIQLDDTSWVFLRMDSLYRWDESDTLDNTERIIARYQSKAFFEGPSREKVFYIDILGTGTCDSLLVGIWDRMGLDSVHTQKVYVDFTDKKRDRVPIEKIVTDCSVRIQDYGTGDYYLDGFVIGWKPWDKGRML